MPTASRFRTVRRDLDWPNPEMTLRDAQRCIERDMLPAHTSQRFEFCKLCADQPDQVAIMGGSYFQWHGQLRLRLLGDLARRIAKRGHLTLLCESKKEESDDSSTPLDDEGGSNNIPPDSGEEGHDPVEDSASETSEDSPDANDSDPEEPETPDPAEDTDSEDSDDGEDGDEGTDGDSSDSESGSQDSKNSDDGANGETGVTSEGRPSQSSPEASRSDTSCETSSSLSDSSDNRNGSSQDGDHTASNTTTLRHDTQAIEQSFTGRTNDTARETTSTQQERGESDSNAGDECLPKETGEEPNDTSEMTGYRYQSPRKGRDRKVSRRSNREYGGVYTYMEDADISSTQVNQIRRAFTALIGGEVSEGPRWDIRRLVKRMTTYRTLYPARKVEHGRPAILLLPDVSGSCSSFTDYTVALSRAASMLGVPGTDVVVVSHSNGIPQEYSVNSYEPESVTTGDVPRWYEDLIKRHNIQFVVCLGDMDAAWVYDMLRQVVQAHRMVWLDNYACNSGAPRRSRVRLDEFPELSKVRYWDRCQDSDDFIQALRLAITSR